MTPSARTARFEPPLAKVALQVSVSVRLKVGLTKSDRVSLREFILVNFDMSLVGTPIREDDRHCGTQR